MRKRDQPTGPERVTRHVDGDGVRVLTKASYTRPALRWLACVVVVGGVVGLLAGIRGARVASHAPPAGAEDPRRPIGEPHAAVVTEPVFGVRPARVDRRAPSASVASSSAAPRQMEPRAAATEQPANDTLEAVARDMIRAAAAAGATEGVAAFPPPGTDPIRIGIVVPDDYELPEGYVRHYQTTDDGRRLEPILMFSPDYEFLDASGQPMPLPTDGIVPAKMAPPGMPVRTLEMPNNPYSGQSDPR